MGKIIDWLLYDKPLFTKPLQSYSRSISKEKWKKNWLGLTLVYDSYDLQYNWCFIKVTSHREEDGCIEDKRNTLSIGFGGRYIKWLLPFSIIKPVLDYKSSYTRDGVEIQYDVYEKREYKISYDKKEGYINIHWNYADQLLYNITKHKSYSKWITLFWGDFSCSCSRWELLNLDKSLYKDITKVDYETRQELDKHHQYIEFTFLDYDKEEITATGKLVRRVYSYGNQNMVTRWIMKFFRKPIDNTYLEMEFHKEIGPNKGSYKGGTTGQGVKLLPDELPEEAFVRYCTDPEVRGFKASILTNMTMTQFKYCKFNNVGEIYVPKLKSLPGIASLSNMYFNIIDYQDRGIKHNDVWDRNPYDLNLKSIVIKKSQDIDRVLDLREKKLYAIVDEKTLGSILFQFWLGYCAPFTKLKINSNGMFIYYFTEEAYNYLKDRDYFKYVEFVEIKNEEDAMKLNNLRKGIKDE